MRFGPGVLASLCAAAGAASVAQEHVMYLRRPLNVSLKKLYHDVPSTADDSWQNANHPAKQGKALVYSFLAFNDSPPPLSYKPILANDDSVIGLYKYKISTPLQPYDESIEIKSGLEDYMEFFVAVHELLHFGGFGTIHWPENSFFDASQNFFNREFQNVREGDPVIGTHWDSISGTHIRSGQTASQEVMTPQIGGEVFVSAATFAACTRETATRTYCLEDNDCKNGDPCILGSATTPGQCNGTGNYELPHETEDDTAYLAIVISMFIIFLFVLIGFVVASFETSFDRIPYDQIKNNL